MTKRILLATRGTATADAAVRIAAALAARHSARVEVFAVLEPLPIFDGGFAPAIIPFDSFDQRRSDELLARVRGQVRAVTGSADAWPIDVRVGRPAAEIARASRAHDVMLVVLGVGRHKPADRLFGNETALKVSRLAPVPVLAVAPGRDQLPRRVIAATDFSASSLEAARTALRFLPAPGTLVLAHVSPELEIPPVALEEWLTQYARGVREGFANAKAHLAAPAGITVQTASLAGDAAQEILQLAERMRADLIAVGSHGHNLVERILIGSVATKVLRLATCSVLLVPAKLQAMEDEAEHERRNHAIPAAVG